MGFKWENSIIMDSNSKVNNVGSYTSAYCLEPLGAKGAHKSCSANQNTFREVWADLEYG